MNPGGLIGETPRMKEVFESVRKIASVDAPVLIQGESGAGKNALAQAVHDLSKRAKEPLISLNCGAIPETLLESELFGHENGAFPGAHNVHIGRLEQADGSTLLLEEIESLNLGIQIGLLRFLQDKMFERMGARKSRSADIRLICTASNILQRLVAEGKFREDLYYRSAVIVINVPPLRDRIGDLPALANSFLKEFVKRVKKPIAGFHPATMQAMMAYHWPGNILELQNVIKRAAIFCEGDLILIEDFPRDLLVQNFSTAEMIAVSKIEKRWELED